MSEKDVIAAITPIFRSVFEDDSLIVTRELDAAQVEAWDSLNHIALVVELESMANVTFSVEELASMETVGDLIDLLLSKGFKGGEST